MAKPFFRTAILLLRLLTVSLLVALAGCAAPSRPPEVIPPVQISESTWRQIDSDISSASLAARVAAENYSRGQMENWRRLVSLRTEKYFIPWFTGYWTQQWLTIKLSWYKLRSENGADSAVKRLAAYLLEQYRNRVLAPVAKEIDPDAVREQAARLYIQVLSRQLQEIPRRYGIPSAQFEGRIKNIPAIALPRPPAHSASLYQIVHAADKVDGLPAYAALMARIREAASGAGSERSETSMSPVAQRASEKLLESLAISGGAGVASTIIGGVAGGVLSLGAAGFGAAAREKERPRTEAQLRECLDTIFKDIWHSLMEDRGIGVMGGVSHMSQQIEGSFTKTLINRIEFPKMPQERPLPDEQPPQGQGIDDEAADDDETTDE
ncbi:MAG: hypothetical protein H6R10_2296 [Rhodocyclaceae bacterium]|nr:hypothetical protein [Rhodocyclaceae bacterium]